MKRSTLALLAVVAVARSASADEKTVQTCLTAHERSNALRKENHLSEARIELLACAANACPGDIRAECSRGVVEVTEAMPTLVVSARDELRGDLVDVKVIIDGKALASHLDGTAIALDPGPHDVTIQTPNGRTARRTLVLREGEKDRRETFQFAAPDAPRVHDPTRRTLGVVTGGAGLAGIVLGVVSGGIAASLWSKSQSECSSPSCGLPSYNLAVGDHDSAQAWANVSTATFIAGGALLAIGGILFFTAPWVAPGRAPTAGLTIGAQL